MNDTKFTMNALVLVVAIFAAIGFFFTVKLGKLADHGAVNEYHPCSQQTCSQQSAYGPDALFCQLKL